MTLIFVLTPNDTITARKSGKVKKVIQYRRDYNMVVNTEIPEAYVRNGYADIARFMNLHPLYPKFSKDASIVQCEMTMEFLYMCEYDEVDDVIEGYVPVNEVEKRVKFNVDDIRRVLELPQMEVYDEEVSINVFMSIKVDVGYDTSKGSCKFQKPCVKGIWKFLLYMVTKCLGCKISIMDQENEMEIQIPHSMLKCTNLNYVALFFKALQHKVVKDTRNSHVLYANVKDPMIMSIVKAPIEETMHKTNKIHVISK